MEARRPAERPVSYLVAFDLADDLRQEGCPMCRAMCRVGEEYLRSLLAADIDDARVKERIKRSGGLCREHVLAAVDVAAWRGDHLGMAIVAEWLLKVAAMQIDTRRMLVRTRRGRQRWRQHSPGTPQCPACEAEAVIVDSYALLLVADPAKARSALVDGEHGLCLPHALRALELTERTSERQLIVELWNRRAERLKVLLSDLVRSHAASQRELPEGRANSAWIEAPEWVAGAARRRVMPRPSRD